MRHTCSVCIRLVVGVLVLSATVACRSSDDPSIARLTVDWRGSEERPGCVYDAGRDRVEARFTVTGWAPRPTKVTVEVTAHADENTSDPVGSGSRTIKVKGEVDELVVVSIPVDEPPHVDIDGVAACSRTVTY